jgi:Zn-dependent M16 (insulinase) family peptidase
MSPDQKGFASLGQFLSGEAAADRQKYRDELLGTTAKDFKAFAERLKAVADSGVAIVFGSQAALEEANAALPEGKKLKIETAVQGRKEGAM